jgi:hypothetical protein
MNGQERRIWDEIIKACNGPGIYFRLDITDSVRAVILAVDAELSRLRQRVAELEAELYPPEKQEQAAEARPKPLAPLTLERWTGER